MFTLCFNSNTQFLHEDKGSIGYLGNQPGGLLFMRSVELRLSLQVFVNAKEDLCMSRCEAFQSHRKYVQTFVTWKASTAQ